MKLFKSINKKGARIACAVLAIVVAVGVAIPLLAQAGVIPQKEAVQSGVTVYKNSKATVDASNLPLGFVSVSYTGGKDVRIKVQMPHHHTAQSGTDGLFKRIKLHTIQTLASERKYRKRFMRIDIGIPVSGKVFAHR